MVLMNVINRYAIKSTHKVHRSGRLF